MYPWLWIVVGVALYGVHCWVWPYRDCPRCRATGRRNAPALVGYRECGRCGGDGRAVRWGARLMGR